MEATLREHPIWRVNDRVTVGVNYDRRKGTWVGRIWHSTHVPLLVHERVESWSFEGVCQELEKLLGPYMGVGV